MTPFAHTLAFLTVIWAVALIFWLVRSGIEIHWKIIALVVFAFYTWYHWDFLLGTWQALQNDYKNLVFNQIKYMAQEVFRLWPLIWTVIMVIVFYMVSEESAEKLVKIFFIFTVFFWLIWLVHYFWGQDLGPWIRQQWMEFLP